MVWFVTMPSLATSSVADVERGGETGVSAGQQGTRDGGGGRDHAGGALGGIFLDDNDHGKDSNDNDGRDNREDNQPAGGVLTLLHPHLPTRIGPRSRGRGIHNPACYAAAGRRAEGVLMGHDRFEREMGGLEDLLEKLGPDHDEWKDDTGKPRQSNWVFRGHGRVYPGGLVPCVLRPKEQQRLLSISLEGWKAWQGAGVRQLQELREFRLLLQFIVDVQGLGLPIPEDAVDSLLFRAGRTITWTDDPYRFQTWRLAAGYETFDLYPWPPSPLWRVIALAQHYGLPTRLLDWSRNPLRAVYAAASSAARKVRDQSTEAERDENVSTDQVDYLEVWALDRTWLREDRKDANGFAARLVEPPATDNPYQAAQTGVFTVVRYEKGEEEVDGARDESPPALDRLVDSIAPGDSKNLPLRVYRLPQSDAPELLRRLGERFITASSAEPDYRGAAKDVMDRLYFDTCFDRYQDRDSGGRCN